MTKTLEHTLEVFRDLIDVTSNNRPDTNWTFTDSHGHVHCWHDSLDGEIASGYKPDHNYYRQLSG